MKNATTTIADLQSRLLRLKKRLKYKNITESTKVRVEGGIANLTNQLKALGVEPEPMTNKKRGWTCTFRLPTKTKVVENATGKSVCFGVRIDEDVWHQVIAIARLNDQSVMSVLSKMAQQGIEAEYKRIKGIIG